MGNGGIGVRLRSGASEIRTVCVSRAGTSIVPYIARAFVSHETVHRYSFSRPTRVSSEGVGAVEGRDLIKSLVLHSKIVPMTSPHYFCMNEPRAVFPMSLGISVRRRDKMRRVVDSKNISNDLLGIDLRAVMFQASTQQGHYN